MVGIMHQWVRCFHNNKRVKQKDTLEEQRQDAPEPIAAPGTAPKIRGARRAVHRVAAGQACDAVPAVGTSRAPKGLEADRAFEFVEALALGARGGAALEGGEALGPRGRVVGAARRRRGRDGARGGRAGCGRRTGRRAAPATAGRGARPPTVPKGLAAAAAERRSRTSFLLRGLAAGRTHHENSTFLPDPLALRPIHRAQHELCSTPSGPMWWLAAQHAQLCSAALHCAGRHGFFSHGFLQSTLNELAALDHCGTHGSLAPA